MKIASYNLEFLFDEGRHVHSGKEWIYSKEHVESRLNYFAGVFSEIDADILFLQEVASESLIKRIIKKTGLGYKYFIARPDQNGVGNAVLFKQKDATCESIPAKASLPVFISGDDDVIGQRIWSRRDFIRLSTFYAGKKLHLIGIHIKSNFLMPEKYPDDSTRSMDDQITKADGLIRSEMFRFSQAKKARELIDSIMGEDKDAYVAICGDFNSLTTESVFKIIQGVNKNAQDSFIEASLQIEPDKLYSVYDEKTGGKKLIDHILVSKNLGQHVKNANILNGYISDNNNKAPNPTMIGSDHAPVSMELQ